MRVLFLTPETYPIFRVDVNVLFGKHLPRYGIHTDLVAGITPEYVGQIVWGGGDTLLSRVSSEPAKKHLQILLHGARCLLLADRTRYQAIQVRDMPVLAVLGLWAARWKGLKFFYWMSYPMPEGQIALASERGLSAGLVKFLFPWLRGRVGRFLLYRVVLRLADHVFVQTECMRESMVGKGLGKNTMTPVPMGVDLEEIEAGKILPIDDPRLEGKRVLVYLGTLDRPRQIGILFEMLAIIRRSYPEVVLVLVGDTEDGVYREQLKEQAAQNGVSEAVIWTGWLPIKEGWRYVLAAEIGLSPIPRGELLDVGSPTKALEYIALGLPIVGNENPDQKWVIEESKCGRCVPYTPEDFSQAVFELLETKSDMRIGMDVRGKEFLRTHRDYAVLSKMVAERYREIIGH